MVKFLALSPLLLTASFINGFSLPDCKYKPRLKKLNCTLFFLKKRVNPHYHLLKKTLKKITLDLDLNSNIRTYKCNLPKKLQPKKANTITILFTFLTFIPHATKPEFLRTTFWTEYRSTTSSLTVLSKHIIIHSESSAQTKNDRCAFSSRWILVGVMKFNF